MGDHQPRSLRSMVISLVSGTGVGQLSVALASPLLTRIYGPEVIGSYAQWFAILSVIVTFASWRWEYTFPSAESTHRPALLRLALLTTATSAAVVTALTLLPGAALGGPWRIWLGPAVFLQVVFQVLFQWCLNVGLLRQASQAKGAHGLWQAGLQVFFGLTSPTPVALILGYIGSALGSLVVLPRAWRERGKASLNDLRWVLRRYWRTPLWVCLSGAMNAIGVQLPILLLGYYSLDFSGQFAIATRSATVPLVLVGVAISQVFLAEVAAGRKRQLSPSLLIVASSSIPALLALIIPLAALGPQLAAVLLGSDWELAGQILRVLSPSLFMVAFSTIVATIPIATGHAKGEAIYQAALLGSRALALLIFVQVDLMAAVAAYTAVTVLCLIVYTNWAFSLVGARLRHAIHLGRRTVLLMAFAVMVSGAGALFYKVSDVAPMWSLAIAAVAGAPLLLSVIARKRPA